MKKRLLLVLDDETICKLIELALSRLRVKRSASSGAALMLARNQIFDIYIIDDHLRDGSGVNLCRNIRRFDHNTPILLLSDPGRAPRQPGLLSTGATASLFKPFDFFQLEAVVASLIRKAEAASLKAAVAELEAIRDSIYDQFTELESQSLLATYRSNLAIASAAAHMSQSDDLLFDNDLLFRAYSVFDSSGGARGFFEELWPTAIECSIHSRLG